MIAHTEVEQPVNPQAEFAKMRQWVVEHCHDKNAIRQAALSMADSAIIHRLMKFGPDETLNNASARDIMRLLIFVNGLMAEWLMRVAYIRAIIEGDHEVYEKFNTTMFIEDHRAWYAQIEDGLFGRAIDPEGLTRWVGEMKGEELSVARLIIARVYPDLALLTWLDDVPPTIPRLAAEILKILATDAMKHGAIKAYLRGRPEVRYSVPDGELP